MTEIINLTRYPIKVAGTTITPSGRVVGTRRTANRVGNINGIPVVEYTYLPVGTLPEPEHGVYYIVTLEVKRQHPDRSDLLTFGEPVWGEDGHTFLYYASLAK